jgi:hypothetical protein
MRKNILDDVTVPAQRKSIKNIPIPNRNRVSKNKLEDSHPVKKISSKKTLINVKKEFSPERENEKHTHDINSSDEHTINLQERRDSFPEQRPRNQEIPREERYEVTEEKISKMNQSNQKIRGGKGKNKILLLFILLVLVIGTISILNIFKSASFTIHAKSESVDNIDIEIPIVNESASDSLGNLVYKEITLNTSAEIKSEADNEELVQEKSRGTITVYNEYSNEPQRLIKNTRFETSDGKIYRIDDSITVPGYTEINGQKKAGELDVTVFADVPGQSYNIGLTEFTIPGFKDQEQFDFFYAKSKTPMSGGFDGVRKIVTEDKKEIARKELQARITNNLRDMIQNQISNEYLYFNGPEDYTYAEIEQGDTNGNEVTLKMSGSSKFIILNKQDFAKSLAKNTNSSINENDTVQIQDIDKIDKNLIEKEGNKYLKILGSANLIWQNDLEEIKEFILNKKEKDIIPLVLQNFKGIIKIENVSIKPFWSNTFPKKTSGIKITEEISR